MQDVGLPGRKQVEVKNSLGESSAIYVRDSRVQMHRRSYRASREGVLRGEPGVKR